MIVPLISIKSVLKNWLEDIDFQGEYNEGVLLKWAQDIVRRIITDEQTQFRIAEIPIRGYKGLMPTGFKKIHQIGVLEGSAKVTREEIHEWTQKSLDGSGCTLTMTLDCPHCGEHECDCTKDYLILDATEQWKGANPKLSVQHSDKFMHQRSTASPNCAFFGPKFKLIKPSSTSFFATEYHLPGCANLKVDSAIEYMVELPNIVVNNMQEGTLFMSYRGTYLDAEGYLMIPDHELVFKAINYGIEAKMMYKEFRKSWSPQHRYAWEKLEEKEEKTIGRAKNELRLPDDDRLQKLMDDHFRKVGPYWGWERNFGKTQKDQYKPWENE
jgi:hypothetical protein